MAGGSDSLGGLAFERRRRCRWPLPRRNCLPASTIPRSWTRWRWSISACAPTWAALRAAARSGSQPGLRAGWRRPAGGSCPARGPGPEAWPRRAAHCRRGRRAHLGADRPAQVPRELVLDVPDLVQLAPSDDRVVKDVHDGRLMPSAGAESRRRRCRYRAARRRHPAWKSWWGCWRPARPGPHRAVWLDLQHALTRALQLPESAATSLTAGPARR